MIRLTSCLPSRIPPDSTVVVLMFEGATQTADSGIFRSNFQREFKEASQLGFEGRAGQIEFVRAFDSRIRRIIFTGLGKKDEVTIDSVRKAVASTVRKAALAKIKKLFIRPVFIGSIDLTAQAMAEGAVLGSYRYTTYQTEKASDRVNEVSLICREPELEAVQKGLKQGETFANATNFARDLINQPPSDTTPADLVTEARRLSSANIRVRIFSKAQIQRLGMGAVLGVNRGSHRPPYFLHLTYRPGRGKIRRKIGICGKGITFDSGGLSLKPAKSMETMKYDMAGAATVLAIFKALAILRPPIEVQGFAPLTENMPGGNALKPGDVLKTLSGKTIEVLNTDAEGRLVLSDTLSYACKQGLDEIIDVATLTGACIIALGNAIAGILGTNRDLIERLKKATQISGEKLWELPLEREYEALLKSPVADIKNIGPMGEAGTIMGALFLKAFVDKNIPWAHIDIASTGWTSSPTSLSEVGATGVMVRSLLQYLSSYN